MVEPATVARPVCQSALSMSASYTASVVYLCWHYRRAIGAEWGDLLPGWPDVRWLFAKMRNAS